MVNNGLGLPLHRGPSIVSDSSPRNRGQSHLPALVQASPAAIEAALLKFPQDASSQQGIRWHGSIRWLQREYVSLLG